MKIRLHVVVDKEDDAVVEVVQKALNEICSKMSYSPSRLQPSLAGCMEFYATSDLNEDEIDDLLSKLNNDWVEKMMIVRLIALIRQCFIQMFTTYNSNLSRIYYD